MGVVGIFGDEDLWLVDVDVIFGNVVEFVVQMLVDFVEGLLYDFFYIECVWVKDVLCCCDQQCLGDVVFCYVFVWCEFVQFDIQLNKVFVFVWDDQNIVFVG